MTLSTHAYLGRALLALDQACTVALTRDPDQDFVEDIQALVDACIEVRRQLRKAGADLS